MARKKDKRKMFEERKELSLMDTQELKELQDGYMNDLETNIDNSLIVDPEDKYGMSEAQRNFVKYYVEFKNVNTAADLAGIDMDTAKSYFIAYSSQQEIRRINKALYRRQFANKLLSLDEVGGYLTSLLTDEDVPIGDRLSNKDKLKVAQMIIDLNITKQEAFLNPEIIMSNKKLDVQIKDLSVKTIKQLLENDEKKDIDNISGNTGLTPEEEAYLSTLPTEDILKLLEETNSKGGNENE